MELPTLEELYEEYKCISNEMVDQSRWHTVFANVYTNEEKTVYYEATFRRGSTENNDEGPEDIEVIEVVPKEVTTTIYVKKT